MRFLPTSISARIVIGFFVLLGTFCGVSAYTIYQMSELGRELRFIRNAYLEVSLQAAQLSSLQALIVDVLDDPTVRRPSVKRNREMRRQALSKAQDRLVSLEDVPPEHQKAVLQMLTRVKHFTQANEELTPFYDDAFGPKHDAVALDQLKQRERKLYKGARLFAQEIQHKVEATTLSLERDEEESRVAALGLGALAALIGLLVTVGAVLTLRPLGRLRDGVRRIAGGDYRQRVDVVGKTEVAEVAREFNAMAAAIEEREQELVRSARLAAVGKMAAVITHEVRNPLSSIGLNTELLEEELAEAGEGATEARSLCRSIHKEVDRLTAITEDYLRFARLPRPKLEQEKVNDIVTGLLEFQRSELEQAGITIEAAYGDALLVVAADEGQLRQALLNLLRNAADAMAGKGGGTLRLVTQRGADGQVEVRVSDTGGGIAPEHLERIFEPFFSTKERGTGLGLALTQQIVVEHGGKVEVESTPGSGTTFTVRLPAAVAAAATTA